MSQSEEDHEDQAQLGDVLRTKDRRIENITHDDRDDGETHQPQERNASKVR